MGRHYHFRPGSFYRVDDRTGFPQRMERTRKQWNNLIVDEAVYEPRQPQDLVRGVRDNQTVGDARPLSPPTFTGPVYVQMTQGAGIAASGIYVESTAYLSVGDRIGVMLDTGVEFPAIILAVGADSITISPPLNNTAASGNLVVNYRLPAAGSPPPSPLTPPAPSPPPAPPPAPIVVDPVAPTLTKTSTSGQNPLSWTAAYTGLIVGSDHIVMRWRLNGGAWTNETAVLADSDFFLNYGVDAVNYQWPLYEAAAVTSGTVVDVQEGVLRNSVTTWSTTLSDTMSTSRSGGVVVGTIALNPTGAYSGLVFSNTSHTIVGAAFNAEQGARSTGTRSASGSMSFSVDTLTSGSRVNFGLCNTATDFTQFSQRPGYTDSNGITVEINQTSQQVWVVMNSAGTSFQATTSHTAGDSYRLQYNDGTNTVTLYRTRGGVETSIGSANYNVSAFTYGWAAVKNADQVTAYFGAF